MYPHTHLYSIIKSIKFYNNIKTRLIMGFAWISEYNWEKIHGGSLLITILSICNMFNYTIMTFILNPKKKCNVHLLYSLKNNLN